MAKHLENDNNSPRIIYLYFHSMVHKNVRQNQLSVAAKKTAYLGNWYSMRSKIDKITEISDSVEHLKNRGVTCWAENYMPLFVQIIEQLQKPVFWLLF